MRVRLLLTALDGAANPAEMNAPGWDLHALKGDLAGNWSVKVNANWRITYLDYH